MKIITHTCPDCGTIVAGNVLAERRQMRCFGPGCDAEIRFEDLPADHQTYLSEHPERYEIGGETDE